MQFNGRDSIEAFTARVKCNDKPSKTDYCTKALDYSSMRTLAIDYEYGNTNVRSNICSVRH
jgi:hypothetical protein